MVHITGFDKSGQPAIIFRIWNVLGARAMDAYSLQAELMKAMAHPTRLRVLDILAQEECCVCHLSAVLRKRQAYVSQQLMRLRDAGLVLDRREGVMIYYRLADPRIEKVITLTRGLLPGAGRGDFPPLPPSPVDGCPCPKCAGEALRSD
jgi:ArsR family transcriptional regulator